jgi:hypothetical protein
MKDITHIRITFVAQQTVTWPHFAGSTLRGAFGRALRRAACVTAAKNCNGCPLRKHCAYGVVFDPAPSENPLHPSFRNGLPRYVMQVPPLGACELKAGQTQHCTLLLMPSAAVDPSLVEHTLKAMIEVELVTPGAFRLLRTHTSQHPVIASAQLDQLAASSTGSNLDRVTLRFLTPLRLQQHGKPIFSPRHLDAPTLAQALYRRQLQWQQIGPSTPEVAPPFPTIDTLNAAASTCRLETDQLHWHDIQRHSTTQNKKLPLGGLIGRMDIVGPRTSLATLRPLLELGAHIHIGKETVMGLGRYQLSWNDTP